MINEYEWELAGETEVLGENLPQSTRKPIWTEMGSNLGHCGRKLATNESQDRVRLNYKTYLENPYL
jgi:hypothetical protein